MLKSNAEFINYCIIILFKMAFPLQFDVDVLSDFIFEQKESNFNNLFYTFVMFLSTFCCLSPGVILENKSFSFTII